MGTRASNVIAYIDATTSFGVKFGKEKVGGNRIEVALRSPRNRSFSEEKKVRFQGGEVMIHRMDVRAKVAYVAEIDREKNLEELPQHLAGSSPGVVSGLGTFLVPSPD